MIDHEGRISTIEADLKSVKEAVDNANSLLAAIHGDMVARRATTTLLGKAFKYILWCVAGVATLLGSPHGHIVADWLKEMPRP